jgi:hypothetical protein
VAHRFDRHHDGSCQQDRGLPQGAEVLRAPVTVGMLAICRPAAEPYREEREHRRDHVAARLDAGGHEAKAPRREPDPELQPDQ